MQSLTNEEWLDIVKNGAYAFEVDWIAVDNLGQVGVFSALLQAPIPRVLGKSYSLYNELMAKVHDLPNKCPAKLYYKGDGGSMSWIYYSRTGLFAFDFKDACRTENERLLQYDLISKPSVPILINELNLSDEQKSIVPEFDWNFDDGDLPISVVESISLPRN